MGPTSEVQNYFDKEYFPPDLKKEIFNELTLTRHVRFVCRGWRAAFDTQNADFIINVITHQMQELHTFLRLTAVKESSGLGKRVVCKLQALRLWTNTALSLKPTTSRNLYILGNYLSIRSLRILFHDHLQINHETPLALPKILKMDDIKAPEEITVEQLTKEFEKLELISPEAHKVEDGMRSYPKYHGSAIFRKSVSKPENLAYVYNSSNKTIKVMIDNEKLRMQKLISFSSIYDEAFETGKHRFHLKNAHNAQLDNGEDTYNGKASIYIYDTDSEPTLDRLLKDQQRKTTPPPSAWGRNQAILTDRDLSIELTK